MFGVEQCCPITFLIFSDDKKESLILKILKNNLNTDKTFDRNDEKYKFTTNIISFNSSKLKICIYILFINKFRNYMKKKEMC